MVATSSTAIVVHPSVPATTLAEFIKYAQSHQKQLSYASAGTGTVTHLAGELFKQLIKAPDITHVPYRGAGPGLSDLVAGTVQMMTPNVTGQVPGFHRAGKSLSRVGTGTSRADHKGRRLATGINGRIPMSSLTLDQANRIIETILKRGAEIGCRPLSVVVVEPGCIVKAFQKEDGSSMVRFEMAYGKAYASLGLCR